MLVATLVATFTAGAGLAQAQDPDPADESTATTASNSAPATTAADSGGIDPSGGTGSGGGGGSGDGSGSTGGEDEPASDGADESDSSSGGGNVELLLANAKPGKAFVAGDPMVFHYAISNSSATDLEVQIVSKKTREVVRTIDQTDITPKQKHSVSWEGRGDNTRWAKEGEYRIRVTSTDGAKADVDRAGGKRKAGLYKHKFPVRGKHTYGDGVGAPRSGHSHQGQDVFAKCGTKLVAAHAGKVQTRSYQSSAGNYVVIDGKKTDMDYVYMHLEDKANVREGEKVKTGDKIGRVGETGNASGCHLHFELWSKPGWYEGGDFLHSVSRKLQKWDRYS
jgi:murein DD-endopeptidase MepM/ murein hydrolase activator NlpD